MSMPILSVLIPLVCAILGSLMCVVLVHAVCDNEYREIETIIFYGFLTVFLLGGAAYSSYDLVSTLYALTAN